MQRVRKKKNYHFSRRSLHSSRRTPLRLRQKEATQQCSSREWLQGQSVQECPKKYLRRFRKNLPSENVFLARWFLLFLLPQNLLHIYSLFFVWLHNSFVPSTHIILCIFMWAYIVAPPCSRFCYARARCGSLAWNCVLEHHTPKCVKSIRLYTQTNEKKLFSEYSSRHSLDENDDDHDDDDNDECFNNFIGHRAII